MNEADANFGCGLAVVGGIKLVVVAHKLKIELLEPDSFGSWRYRKLNYLVGVK